VHAAALDFNMHHETVDQVEFTGSVWFTLDGMMGKVTMLAAEHFMVQGY